eukprot:SAG31_NODE_42210_length_272_cov_1.190751_1_plen_61_part_01
MEQSCVLLLRAVVLLQLPSHDASCFLPQLEWTIPTRSHKLLPPQLLLLLQRLDCDQFVFNS